jgi:hypothetical protein
MNGPADLLFNTKFENRPLFINQLDLVNYLLNTPGSRYHSGEILSELDLKRAQSRLKTYISQLLSDTVYRNVTEDFKFSLRLVLAQLLPAPQVDRVFSQIISALELKNSSLAKKTEPISALEDRISLKEDIIAARHIVVVSARPIDMTLPLNEEDHSIRSWFYRDLVTTLLTPGDHSKFYRFNFPTTTYCDLFWAGLEKLIVKFVLRLSDVEDYIFSHYHHSFSITPQTLHEYEEYQKEKPSLPVEVSSRKSNTIINKIAREIIEQAERNKTILVFHNNHPIFSIPIIGVNPNESSIKVYGILDMENNQHSAYKFTQENTILWRIFFWDKLKASDTGECISYKKTVSRSSPDEVL